MVRNLRRSRVLFLVRVVPGSDPMAAPHPAPAPALGFACVVTSPNATTTCGVFARTTTGTKLTNRVRSLPVHCRQVLLLLLLLLSYCIACQPSH